MEVVTSELIYVNTFTCSGNPLNATASTTTDPVNLDKREKLKVRVEVHQELRVGTAQPLDTNEVLFEQLLERLRGLQLVWTDHAKIDS